MTVTDVISLDGSTREEIGRIVSYMQGAEEGLNATGRALIAEFGKIIGQINDTVPFSSERKYSAADIEEIGIYAIGAPHFVPCDIPKATEERIEEYASRGEINRKPILLLRIPILKKMRLSIRKLTACDILLHPA